MPASDLEVSISTSALYAVCTELQITAPIVVITDDPPPAEVQLRFEPGTKIHGLHTRIGGTSKITIYTNHSFQKSSRLLLVKKEMVTTILHEIRHSYQHAHWGAGRMAADDMLPYEMQEKERDAEEWARDNSPRLLSLVKVNRRVRRTSFGRLSAAEQRVRG